MSLHETDILSISKLLEKRTNLYSKLRGIDRIFRPIDLGTIQRGRSLPRVKVKLSLEDSFGTEIYLSGPECGFYRLAIEMNVKKELQIVESELTDRYGLELQSMDSYIKS